MTAAVVKPRPVLRIAAAVFLVLHGIAHFVGLADLAGTRPKQAVAWGVAGVLFFAAAAAVVVRPTRARRAVATAAAVSLVMTLTALPEAVIGLVLDVVVLAAACSPSPHRNSQAPSRNLRDRETGAGDALESMAGAAERRPAG